MATVPNLISPTTIQIEQKSSSSTSYDTLAREPVKTVSRDAAIELPAQVSWGKSYASRYFGGGQGGTVQDATGYLVFRVTDIDAIGVTLAQGDKVTRIGGAITNVFLSDRTLVGHHDGAPTLEIWDVIDRPLKARR